MVMRFTHNERDGQYDQHLLPKCHAVSIQTELHDNEPEWTVMIRIRSETAWRPHQRQQDHSHDHKSNHLWPNYTQDKFLMKIFVYAGRWMSFTMFRLFWSWSPHLCHYANPLPRWKACDHPNHILPTGGTFVICWSVSNLFQPRWSGLIWIRTALITSLKDFFFEKK